MVLGISLRKKRKPEDKESQPAPVLRPSPSLPDLNSNSGPLQWPSNLVVNMSLVSPKTAVASGPSVPLARTASGKAPIIAQPGGPNRPYHRPWRSPPVPLPSTTFQTRSTPSSPTTSTGNHAIASLYTSDQPTSFSRTTYAAPFRPSASRRAPHVAPTFNIMTVGGTGSGKTSLVRLFLDTCHISSAATPAQLRSVEAMTHGAVRSTHVMEYATVEIDEGSDRVTLGVTDTPGLKFNRGAELDLERSVTAIIRHVEAKYAETLSDESKVVRQSKQGHQHIHVCIYLITPESIQPITVHPETNLVNRSSTDNPTQDDLNHPNPSTSPVKTMAMRDAEVNVIKRLSTRVNVMPVICRADMMTNDRLEEVKNTVRRDLGAAGVSFGLLGTAGAKEDGSESVGRRGKSSTLPASDDEEEEEEEDAERAARPVVRIRSTRQAGALGRRPSRSRSRARAALTNEDLGSDHDADDHEAFPQTSSPNSPAQLFTHTSLRQLLPFAVMSPDPFPLRAEWASIGSTTPTAATPLSAPPSAFRGALSPTPPPREELLVDLRGKYLRKYRWGEVDVLDPAHCDFLALRHSVFGPQMRMLRQTTREVLYESFRTEKLLVRRATQNITDDARGRLLRDLGV